MAAIAKALGDPIRLQLVDVLRKHAGKVCVCELVPLFDVSQPTSQPPPQEAARGRHRRLRAARAVGLLLRHPRRPGGAVRMAELTDDELREHVRERYAAPPAHGRPRCRRPAAAADARRTGGADCAAARTPSRRGASSAATSTTRGHRRARRRRRSPRRSAAACRPRSPTCTRARRCSTSARAPAPTCSSAPAASAPTGSAIGLDMTDEMLALARANAAQAGVDERRVRQGLPRGDPAARRERRRRHLQLRHQPRRRQDARPARGRARPAARRSLRGLRRDRRRRTWTRRRAPTWQQWTGCVAGALTRARVRDALAAAGLVDVEIRETHRVHEHAASAIVRARRP